MERHGLAVTVTAQVCCWPEKVTVMVAVPAECAAMRICDPWPCATVATVGFDETASACWVTWESRRAATSYGAEDACSLGSTASGAMVDVQVRVRAATRGRQSG